MKKSEFRSLIREEIKKTLKENGPLMSDPSTKSKVEMVINTLRGIDVDGETMQYILKQVGMEEQMLHQLTGGNSGKNEVNESPATDRVIDKINELDRAMDRAIKNPATGNVEQLAQYTKSTIKDIRDALSSAGFGMQ